MELVNVMQEKKVRRGMHIASAALARFSQGRTRILAPLPHAAAPSLPAPHGVAASCLACLAYGIAFRASSDVARGKSRRVRARVRWAASVAHRVRHEPCRASGKAGGAVMRCCKASAAAAADPTRSVSLHANAESGCDYSQTRATRNRQGHHTPCTRVTQAHTRHPSEVVGYLHSDERLQKKHGHTQHAPTLHKLLL